ncbi:MAG: hypothetical protein A3G24_23415 [Betaproteobacteria bacterium RIFCSPLOWO2_12_FULL_62_13]|nr:MAG: hypothetical protein A3G24_23415 [Betaproteobacteria bacterium RIFCSPLOWO2_12_FULL_62_13]
MWRDEVRIALSPQRVAAVRLARGFRPRLLQRKVVACGQAHDEHAWAPAIEALREALAPPDLADADTVVILSDHFVRYLLLRWNPALVTEEEDITYARARFGQVFGAGAENWAIRLSGAKAGTARVASAVEQTLLDAVGALAAQSRLNVRSIQPHLMAAFNAWGGRRARAAWLAIAEPRRLMLGLREGGEWRSLRSRPLNDGTGSLAEFIEQERKLLGIGPGVQLVFLHAVDGVSLDAAGVRVERLTPGNRPGLAPRDDGELALALCGVT